jgi:O-antigen chain-terminating methyltransferase
MFGTKEQVEKIIENLEQPTDADALGGKNGQQIANQLLGRDALKSIEENHVADNDLQAVVNRNNQLYEIHYYRDLVSSVPVLGKVVVFFKKLVRRVLFYLIQPMVDEQNAFNASVTQSINGMNNLVLGNHGAAMQRAEELSAALREEQAYSKQLEQQLASDEKRMEEDGRRIQSLEECVQSLLPLGERVSQIADTQQVQTVMVRKLQKQWKEADWNGYAVAKPAAAEEGSAVESDGKPGAVQAPSETSDTYEMIDYINFENNFRGSQESIRRAQEVYVKYFEGKSNVLDMGCGRGEFLSLLKEHNISARGVELYDEFVELCREKDLDVIGGDAIAYLRTLEDDSLGGIFAAQLVEHLLPEQINTICVAAYDKLRKGSCIILETPNPRCLSIYANAFYVDPSHVKPVHPETLKYFMKQAGFTEVEILYTETSRVNYELPLLNAEHVENLAEFNNGIKQVSELLYGSQDYAIIARK